MDVSSDLDHCEASSSPGPTHIQHFQQNNVNAVLNKVDLLRGNMIHSKVLVPVEFCAGGLDCYPLLERMVNYEAKYKGS